MRVDVDELDVAARNESAEILAVDDQPEGLVEELDLADHLKGYWPSSKNVSQ